ncbi:hypothetical protein LINPERPRIM_LOCUS6690 [Linum perenne]
MMCSYSFSKQTDIVLAYCAIHNFIRIHAQGDSLFAEFEESDGQAETSESVGRIEFGTSSTQYMIRLEISTTLLNSWEQRGHGGGEFLEARLTSRHIFSSTSIVTMVILQSWRQ